MKMVLATIISFVVLIAGLVALAYVGNITAIVILAVMGTVIVMGLGASSVMLSDAIRSRREERRFMHNTQENLAMMAAMQTVQNKQNQMLLSQANRMGTMLDQSARYQAPQLIGPRMGGLGDSLSFDEEMFAHLNNDMD